MSKFKTKINSRKPVTRVAFVIDESGSMGHLRKEVVDSFNEQLQKIQEQKDQTSYVSLWTFEGANIKEHIHAELAQNILPWEIRQYNPRGSTPLAEATLKAAKSLGSLHAGDEDAYLLVVITDGQENASSNEAKRIIAQTIQTLNSTDQWTFVFIGPPGCKAELQHHFGALPGNIIEWEGTREGVRSFTGQTVNALSGYYGLRSSGVRSTRSFFQPDLSKVTPSQVTKALDDVTPKFRAIPVDRECEIKSLVEAKTGQYVQGSAFYELTKREEVQNYKQMLLVNRKTKKIFGGDVRGFLQVPDGTGVGYTRVEPGNHADYRIFVQSTSTNRKLVRGTDVLVAR